jgi:hypothetical protein
MCAAVLGQQHAAAANAARHAARVAAEQSALFGDRAAALAAFEAPPAES